MHKSSQHPTCSWGTDVVDCLKQGADLHMAKPRSKRLWVAVLSAGPCASLHLASDRQPRCTPALSSTFLQVFDPFETGLWLHCVLPYKRFVFINAGAKSGRTRRAPNFPRPKMLILFAGLCLFLGTSYHVALFHASLTLMAYWVSHHG